MQRVPQEGVWFSVSYVSNDLVTGSALPARYHGKNHKAGSAIYDVMTREDFSAMHRLQTDETWHFYGGDPIDMLLLYPDGHGETVTIGPDVFAGQQPQFTVPQGVWQGSAPIATGAEGYSFAGNQLSPAFDYGDFEIGYRDELQKAFPSCAARIGQLTRAEFATRPAATAAVERSENPAAASVFKAETSKLSRSRREWSYVSWSAGWRKSRATLTAWQPSA